MIGFSALEGHCERTEGSSDIGQLLVSLFLKHIHLKCLASKNDQSSTFSSESRPPMWHVGEMRQVDSVDEFSCRTPICHLFPPSWEVNFKIKV